MLCGVGGMMGVVWCVVGDVICYVVVVVRCVIMWCWWYDVWCVVEDMMCYMVVVM